MSDTGPTYGPDGRSSDQVDHAAGEPVAEQAPDQAAGPQSDEAQGDTSGADTEQAAEPAEPDWEAVAAEDPRTRAELLAELHEAEARRDEYLEDVRRARAEFENYRKRMLREGTAQRSAGSADTIAVLLDVLDDFDRTIEHADEAVGEEADDPFRKGVGLVHDKLVSALENRGLKRIDETDVTFDPNRHEAVSQIPAEDEVDEPVVHQVMRPGYEVDGRVLRAAMVVVKQ